MACCMEVRNTAIGCIERDLSLCKTAKLLNLAPSTVVRWHQRWLREVTVASWDLGGDCRGGTEKARVGNIIGWVDKQPWRTNGDFTGRLEAGTASGLAAPENASNNFRHGSRLYAAI